MIIGILKEPAADNRVVCLPEITTALVKMNIKVLIENNAGAKSYASDEDYKNGGAEISSVENILAQADMILRIASLSVAEINKMKSGAVAIAVFQPLWNKEIVIALAEKNISSFSLDMIPRTTRAQAMDILSSQATAAGYKAVLTAAVNLPKFFPMFMTAAGTITPAKVLILGAGVAGLQAIATAKRLGAVVMVFDTRTAVKEEVMSLGGKFIEVEGAADSKAAGGYAVEQSEEFKQRQAARIADEAAKSDVVISTAQIPGRKAPILIPKSTLDRMKSGAVIIDLAASTGGNCELTKNNETVIYNNISIIGDSNLPSSMPSDSSKMFGKNVMNLLKLMITKEGAINLNFEDDIVLGCCITHNGEIKNERVKEAMKVAVTS